MCLCVLVYWQSNTHTHTTYTITLVVCWSISLFYRCSLLFQLNIWFQMSLCALVNVVMTWSITFQTKSNETLQMVDTIEYYNSYSQIKFDALELQIVHKHVHISCFTLSKRKKKYPTIKIKNNKIQIGYHNGNTLSVCSI